MTDPVEELVAALTRAKSVIRDWHGPVAWEIYDRASPEMIQINAALSRFNAERGKGVWVTADGVEAVRDLYRAADELDSAIDDQTYDERVKADFNHHEDDELSVNITAGQARALGKALNHASLALAPMIAAINPEGKT